MKVLTAQAMRDLDRRAIEVYGIPGMVLMENAAIGAVDALASQFPTADAVAVVCGPGHNGGDGLAMARHLDGRGYACRVFVVADRPPQGDAGHQLEILERSGMTVERLGPDDDLDALSNALSEADVVVDALFGTGLSRPLQGRFAAVVSLLESSGVPCLAVDLPSGLDASRASPIGPHSTAELTVTFGLPKIAHVLPPSCDVCGTLVVADLGVPRVWIDEAPDDLHVLEASTLAPRLVPRPTAGHKGTFGHALVIAGGAGTSGAATLAVRATLRAGAGLVTAAVPSGVQERVATGAIAAMTIALPQGPEGGLSVEAVASALAAMTAKEAVAIGPGLGTAPDTQEAIRSIVLGSEAPLVLDADGLNAFAGQLTALRGRRAPMVLTPHPGEMGRLLGCSTAEVVADRLGAARQAAGQCGAVVLLKGQRTLIAAPGGPIAINPTGNPGMATGGSGDVLTGVIVALLAQGHDAWEAACMGAFVHGLAGDHAAARLGEIATGAEDLVAFLPSAFRHWTDSGGEAMHGRETDPWTR